MMIYKQNMFKLKKRLIKINPLKTEVMVFYNIHNDYDIE